MLSHISAGLECCLKIAPPTLCFQLVSSSALPVTFTPKHVELCRSLSLINDGFSLPETQQTAASSTGHDMVFSMNRL